MAQSIWNLDFSRTVRDFDFTRKAMQGISRVVTSDDFEDMDVDAIFDYLLNEMEIVVFRDYLKRYIYERAGMKEPFFRVPDETYLEIILDSFDQNRAPVSLTPTTVKRRAMVKRWLDQDSVTRQTVFALGFGLRMTAEDVGDFLTKVIKESGFDDLDPRECAYRYCYTKNLPYAKAVSLMNGEAAPGNAEEKQLADRIAELKKQGDSLTRSRRAQSFRNVYRECRELVAGLYQEENDTGDGSKVWKPEDIGPSDIERILCDGIPTVPGGNRMKMSSSLLNRQFRQKRITRQRLDSLLKGELEIERYDLITLQFLIDSQKEDENPRKRCLDYLDRMNGILTGCGMQAVYPANPYEAFILMCMLTEMPLLTYYDVWEKSYGEPEHSTRDGRPSE